MRHLTAKRPARSVQRAALRYSPRASRCALRDKRPGFTIVELMVAIALMLMLMGVAVFVFVNAVRIFTKTSAETQIYQAAQVAMDTLRSDIQVCRPLLTPDGLPNSQQMVVLFDADQNAPDVWRFDRLALRTTTADPAAPETDTERWVLYWVQGGDAAAQMHGTLMKYVSPGLIPPCTDGAGADLAALAASPPTRPSSWTADWVTDGAELCQNVSLFKVEIFHDPDADAATTGLFLDSRAAALAYPWDGALYGPYFSTVGAAGTSAFHVNATYYKDPPANPAYNMYLTGWDAFTTQVRIPSQLRVTLEIQDEKGQERRMIQEQVWIPMAH